MKKRYPTDLTNSQFNTILAILKDEWKRKHSLREIFDGIIYMLKTGCQWRMIPDSFPKWELIYYYFTKWKNNGTIEMIHKVLRDLTWRKAGKEIFLSIVYIDSQYFKAIGGAGGKKRHIIIDTMGL
jgi:transposase